MERQRTPRELPWSAIAILALLGLGVAVSVAFYSLRGQEHVRSTQDQELTAIADLKVDQIVQWRGERVADAVALSRNPLVADALLRVLRGGRADETATLHALFDSLADSGGYTQLYLLDPQGARRAVVGAAGDDADLPKLAKRALDGREPVLSELHRNQDGALHFDLVAPLYADRTGAPVGALGLRADPRPALYPLLQFWPAPSDSAETLLVRSDGDQVVVLNPQPRRGGAPLTRLPKRREHLPSSAIELGTQAPFLSRDQFGREVLAVTREVPDTGWVLVAKVDAAEVLAPAEERFWLAIIAMSSMFLAAAAGLGLLFRRHQLRSYRKEIHAERTRRHLESKYAYLVQHANDVILLLDDELNIVEANDRAITSYGYPREELLKMNIEQLRQPQAPSEVQPNINTGAGMLFETVHQRKNGSTFHVEVSTRALKLDQSRSFQCIIRDVSERKQAEAALRESEQSLSTTLQSIGDAVVATDAFGRILRMNPVAEKLSGWALQLAKGKRLEDVLRMVDAASEKPVPCPASRALQENRSITVSGASLLPRDDSPRPISAIAAPIRDLRGTTAGVVVVFRDVSEERAAQQALAYQAELLGSIHDAVLGLDEDLVVRLWNRAAEEIYGFKAAEAVGRSMLELLPTDWGMPVDAMKEELRSKGRFAAELVQTRRDGVRLSIEMTLAALLAPDGRRTGYVCVGRDLTDRKRMQSRLLLADRLASVGTLAAGVAHEINNPLAFIIANLQFLADQLTALASGGGAPTQPDELQRALRDAQDGAERVRRIVRDLKTFSRSDEEQRATVDVRDALGTALHIAHNSVRHRAQLLTDLGEVPAVEANESRLTQVFLNLIVNAAQAMPEGAVASNQIHLSTRTDPTGRAVVEVRDTGSGIPDDAKARLFDPFFTTKPVGEGTGLGLAICHGIVTSLGGEIQVESEVGKGSLFRVLLPGVAQPAPEPAPVSGPSPVPAEAAAGRILLVDDEQLVGRAVERILSPPHQVVVLSSAREALARLTDGESFDVVLCDLSMPEMTGIDLYEQVAKSRPNVAAKFVFMTGGAFTERAEKFLESCPTPTVEKPFDARHLRKVVGKVVEGGKR